MGGFYGSVQVRTSDRDSVRAAVEDLSQGKDRFLLGPILNGWVGVYSQHHGQDFDVSRELARRLGGELMACLVHDDDIFAYEYYRDGECIDQYNSVPDYFGEVSEAKRRKLSGRLETFSHLATDPSKFLALAQRMASQAEARDVFASQLLEEFAEALGIRNAVTSYEYLKDHEETEGIEGWDQFIHVPDLAAERARKAAARALLANEKKRLIKAGRLLSEKGGARGWGVPSPWWCPAPDGVGFLVAWSSHAYPREQKLPLELHGHPWSEGPLPTPWAIDPHVYGLDLSPSGRYLAVAHAAGSWKASLWDLHEHRLVADTPQVRAVSSVGFLANESAMFSVSSTNDEGRVVVTPTGEGETRSFDIAGASLAAAHPAEPWLVVADIQGRLHVLDLTSGQTARTHLIMGRFNPTLADRPVMTRLADRWVVEHPYKLGFHPGGEWLFASNKAGVRAYAWRDILEADDMHPAISADVPPSVMETDEGTIWRERSVYDFDHDSERNRLVFASLDGRVHYLDLAKGQSGVLLEPPGLPPIRRLGLSRDRAALALTCLPEMLSRSAKKRGPVLQFWNYAALSEG